ncbi:MAG: hypothetical protein A3I66_07795 [Burkholderiales bacterium RIFCSPLOWO2_02_FULL_57_36]|nr:MAG: hypothetical protein A3I66_07795 [Burkholderiales bacterium RIFCSPLOWO2_02_FULL_57_36]
MSYKAENVMSKIAAWFATNAHYILRGGVGHLRERRNEINAEMAQTTAVDHATRSISARILHRHRAKLPFTGKNKPKPLQKPYFSSNSTTFAIKY